jgi:NADH:ubiquinone reductase (non-electrogenic)
VYALGDAADIVNGQLPTTAEVAVQKAKWLAQHLIDVGLYGEATQGSPFVYKNKAMIANLGEGDGVVQGKTEWTGIGAFLAWRSGSLTWARGWRRRVMVVVNWVANLVDGREIARR